MRAAILAGLLGAASLAGCSLLAEPGERELAGPTDGHQPTATYLKVFVRRDDGTLALLDFERRDWYVAEIVRKLDLKEVDYLGATVMPRHTLNEYVVQKVSTPLDLQALRYDEMAASPEARARMDAEYEEVLRKLVEDALENAPSPPLLGPAVPDTLAK